MYLTGEQIGVNSHAEIGGHAKKLSRREWLKLVTMGSLSMLLPPQLSDNENWLRKKEVEVIGDDQPIVDLGAVYKADNDQFLQAFSMIDMLNPDWVLRSMYWGFNRRSVEVVVRESDYRNSLNGSFVEDMQLHVDFYNRIMREANPVVEQEMVLDRVVVVDDKFTSHPTGSLPSIMFDHTEFWNDENEPSYLMSLTNTGDQLEVQYVDRNRKGVGEKMFMNNSTAVVDSISGIGLQKPVWLSIKTMHEWRHRVGQTVDLSFMEITNPPKMSLFPAYMIKEDLNEPRLSPFTALFMQEMIKLEVRGSMSHPLSRGTSVKSMTDIFRSYTPNEVELTISSAESLVMTIPDMTGIGYYPSKNLGKKMNFENGRRIESSGRKLIVNKADFPVTEWEELVYNTQGELVKNGKRIPIIAPVTIIDARVNGGRVQLHLPISVMLTMGFTNYGKSVSCEIELGQTNTLSGESLSMDIIGSEELDKFLLSMGGKYYAKMLIPNSNAVVVWYQANERIIMDPVQVMRTTVAKDGIKNSYLEDSFRDDEVLDNFPRAE